MKFTLQWVSVFLLVTIVGTTASAQSENKVENGSFENLLTKVKGPGQFDEITVEGWSVPRDCPPADIFTNDTKKEEVMTPTNARGAAEPLEGNNYAGILVYSDREANPRTFVQAKFSKTLLANKEYCVKFNISLSDLSKYAINNIGAYISASAPKLKDIETYEIKPQIMHSRNIIHEEMFDWVTICQTFVADGTEKYITIGNFAAQDVVETKTVKRPREFSQPQNRDSYYYIDDVSVVATAHMDGACFCEDVKEDINQLQVVYTKNVADEINMDPKTSINLKKLYFESLSDVIKEESKASLNEIATLMGGNPAFKLTIIGHNDYLETAKSPEDFSTKRAAAVKAYLEAQGVAGSRITVEGKRDTMPASKEETTQGRAQNRRVEFEVK